MQKTDDSRSMAGLCFELADDLRTLVRKELELFKTDISQQAGRVVRDIAMVAVGGIAAYVGFLAVAASVILLMAMFIQPWIAALGVGIVLGPASS